MTYQDRHTGGPAQFRTGETRTIEHLVSAWEGEASKAFTVASCRVDIYRDGGAQVVTNAQAAATEGAKEEHRLTYAWNTTGVEPGRYHYIFKAVVGSETLLFRGEIGLRPVVSRRDAYLTRMRGCLLLPETGDAGAGITESQLLDALDDAVGAYSQGHPLLKAQEYPGDGSRFEWPLPVDWANGYSRITAVEYPVDDEEPYRAWLEPDAWEWDEQRGKWRLTRCVPAAGNTARIYYSAPHILTDTQDSIPPQDRPAVSQYGAGLALLRFANEAARRNAPEMGADLVNGRTKEQEFGARAKAMIAQAEEMLVFKRSLAAGRSPV